jgi:hypothetical protein
MTLVPRSVLLCAAAMVTATAAQAAPARVEMRNTLGAMANVIGFENITDASLTWGLSHSENPLVKDAHLSLGATNTLSPAYDRVALWAEVSPLSILDVRVGFEPSLYFGLFNSLQDFRSYDAVYDEQTRKDTNDASYLGMARRAYIAPTFKIKLGRVVAFSGAEIEWWKAGGDGPYFYEPARDTLLDTEGDRVLRSSSGLLYELRQGEGRQLLLGPFHQIMNVEGARANRVQRVGVLGLYDLGGHPLGLRKPSLIGQLAYYLDDRFKKHEPWALVALRFQLGPHARH